MTKETYTYQEVEQLIDSAAENGIEEISITRPPVEKKGSLSCPYTEIEYDRYSYLTIKFRDKTKLTYRMDFFDKNPVFKL